MLLQIQQFLIGHTLTVLPAGLPEYALTFILSAVTSLLPQQSGNSSMRECTYTYRGKTPSNSADTRLVLEFIPKRPWMTLGGLKIQSLQKMDRLFHPWCPVPVSGWRSAPCKNPPDIKKEKQQVCPAVLLLSITEESGKTRYLIPEKLYTHKYTQKFWEQ